MLTAATEWDASRHELVLAAQQAVVTGNHLLALELSEAVTSGATFVPDDVLFSLSSIAVNACWPAPPYGGFRDLDQACLAALNVDVRSNQ